ncbi:MAG: hypothetical protein R3274_04775 [Desulfobacterales bacterium]|nr:hypothetical protein [Desulfobacterales bacterium]
MSSALLDPQTENLLSKPILTPNIESKIMHMAKRKMYNTTLDADLIKEIRILAAQLEKRQNDLLEEAIQDLLEKYKFKPPVN